MTTIILADDHALVREGIRALLERMEDIQVVSEATDGQQAVDLVEKLTPDLLLIDLSMPRLNGIEALHHLKSNSSTTRVIVVSVHTDETIILRALRAGAKGYLLKDSFKEELYLAVRSVARGEVYLSPKLASIVLSDLISGSPEALVQDPLERLSAREREVFQLILESKTNRQIAKLLNLSMKTIDKHRTNLMRKLGVHDIAGLVHIAVEHNLLYVHPSNAARENPQPLRIH